LKYYQITDVFNGSTFIGNSRENPAFAWDLNMNSLFHVLNLAKAGKIKKYFGLRVLRFWTNTSRKHAIYGYGTFNGLRNQ
jgi:hypothetical protein